MLGEFTKTNHIDEPRTPEQVRRDVEAARISACLRFLEFLQSDNPMQFLVGYLDETCWKRAAFEVRPLSDIISCRDENLLEKFDNRYAELRNGWRAAMNDLSTFPAGISKPDLWQVEFEECEADAVGAVQVKMADGSVH
ncbi:hypothetical protein [Bradyrhizobium sp. WYCCWR 12699]|uniref:hypothetical protein n=1 Tax=Bradyrhizobium sp. WYCCWR 12699 TaxID=3064203 RepID=UPI0028A31883|nr:hypothetical protein [Bradyrhizobium sp. WYCCWR 12699]MDT4740248.1 hypothetical protein [Bradyrhizobium sp. WYCCWR 12699]